MGERFSMKIEHNWICARPDEKGDWVRHSDYEALERESAELRAERKEARKVKAKLERLLSYAEDNAAKYQNERREVERRNAELEADNLRLQNEWDNCDEMLQATRADKARLSEALSLIEDVDFDGYSISELHEYVTDIARAALGGQADD